MKRRILAVCDSESLYTYQLAEHFDQKKGISYEVHAFSGWQPLASFMEQYPVEVLLIEEDEVSEELDPFHIPVILILSGEKMSEQRHRFPTVYKYQAAAGIVGEVMNLIGETAEELYPAVIGKQQKAEIIGVYSPVSNVGKTSFALTLGKIFSEEKSVLYINLEPYSGLGGLWEKEFRQDLTDLIYAVCQNSGAVIAKLNQMAESSGKLDYIPPAAVPLDLSEVVFSEWSSLLAAISNSGLYEVIVLDVGVQISLEVLKLCQIIYTPVRDKKLDRMKVEQYQNCIGLMGLDEVLEKTHFLTLPLPDAHNPDADLDSLVWSGLGQFIKREILNRQAGGTYGSTGDTKRSSGKNQYIERDF